MNEPYRPVACALHDEYEIAIMRKNRLHLMWLDDDGNVHNCEVLPEDILVKDKSEYLLASDVDNQHTLCIRLDKITLLPR